MKQKQNNQTETSIRALQKAILDLHGCNSTWIESIQVGEVFESQTVWERVVQVFDLIDHPTAKPMHGPEIGGFKKRKFFAVLQRGPVESAEKASRAAIIRDQSYNGIQGKII